MIKKIESKEKAVQPRFVCPAPEKPKFSGRPAPHPLPEPEMKEFLGPESFEEFPKEYKTKHVPHENPTERLKAIRQKLFRKRSGTEEIDKLMSHIKTERDKNAKYKKENEALKREKNKTHAELVERKRQLMELQRKLKKPSEYMKHKKKPTYQTKACPSKSQQEDSSEESNYDMQPPQEAPIKKVYCTSQFPGQGEHSKLEEIKEPPKHESPPIIPKVLESESEEGDNWGDDQMEEEQEERKHEIHLSVPLARLAEAQPPPPSTIPPHLLMDPMNIDTDHMSYEQLLELEAMIGNVSKGLTPEQTNSIPTLSYDLSFGSETTLCSICQYDLVLGEKVKVLPCDHIFHSECVVPWFKEQKTCPICGAHVIPEWI